MEGNVNYWRVFALALMEKSREYEVSVSREVFDRLSNMPMMSTDSESAQLIVSPFNERLGTVRMRARISKYNPIYPTSVAVDGVMC